MSLYKIKKKNYFSTFLRPHSLTDVLSQVQCKLATATALLNGWKFSEFCDI